MGHPERQSIAGSRNGDAADWLPWADGSSIRAPGPDRGGIPGRMARDGSLSLGASSPQAAL